MASFESENVVSFLATNLSNNLPIVSNEPVMSNSSIKAGIAVVSLE